MSAPLRDRWLERWGRTVATHPRITLLACGLVAAASVVGAVLAINLKADRNDLIDQSVSWAARYATYRADFPRWDDLIICLEGDADDASVTRMARTLASTLRTLPRIDHAVAGFSADQVGPRLWRTADDDAFNATLQSLSRARDIAAAPTAADALVEFMQQDADGDLNPDDLLAALGPFIDAIEGHEVQFDLLAPLQTSWTPMTTEDGRIRLVMVGLSDPDGNGVAGLVDDLAWLRDTVERELAADSDASPRWGITGIPAIETDETAKATEDATIASIVAFVLVTALLVIVFHRPRLPLMAAIALVTGIAWSFGWVAVSVGHLQLLSMVFSAILIGLGIDFALHLTARMRHVQSECDSFADTSARAFREVGPGLITGAVTTAAAFGCTAFSEFLGMAEMGIIAAGGVLLCLIAVMCTFPALMATSRGWRRDLEVMRPLGTPLMNATGPLLRRRAGTCVVLGLLATAALAWSASHVRYNSNIMHLQPRGLEAVTWQRQLAESPGGDLWSGLILTEPGNAAELVRRLRTVDGVAEVGGMGLLFPPGLEARQHEVQEVRSSSLPTWQGRDNLGFIPTVLDTIRAQLRSMLDTAPSLEPVVERLNAGLTSWRNLDRNVREREARIERLEQAWARDRVAFESYVTAALAASPPGPDDLPQALRAQWIGTDGRWLLRAAPVITDQSILEPERLGAFVEAVRQVAPDVLGPPVQIYESSRLIVTAYVTSGTAAIIVVLLVLLLDFRSIPDALCAMLPVTIGFIGAFGFMGAVGLRLNFANLMVLPMIFGIGVDSGVHIVHRWRSDRAQLPTGLGGGTGTGVILTTTTTAIAFGTLMIAEHRGIRSLAIVMVAGLATTLAACWFVLPPMLDLRRRLSRRSGDQD